MISGEAWLAFVAVSVLVLLVPGPTVLLVVAYALRHGRGSAFWTVPGVALGDAAALTASLSGLGMLLVNSPRLFAMLRFAGAAYLIILGGWLWRNASDERVANSIGAPAETADLEAITSREGWRMLANAFIVTALNPGSIAFFIAFLPQFLSVASPALPQLALLGTTFVTLAAVNAAVFAYLAGSLNRYAHTGRLDVLIFRLRRLAAASLIAAGVLAVVVDI